MDFGRSDQALNSKCRDFDLNIPYLEDLNSNDENQFSPLIQNNTRSIQDMNITVANDKNNQVHTDGSIFLANSFTRVSDDDARQVHPMMFIDSLRVAGYDGIIMRVRRRYRGRGRAHPTNPYRCCTNVHCKTRKTPKWRKGPLGPKTLCNACGIHFKKQVTGGGSVIRTAIVDGGASASPLTYVPSGTVEGDYLNF